MTNAFSKPISNSAFEALFTPKTIKEGAENFYLATSKDFSKKNDVIELTYHISKVINMWLSEDNYFDDYFSVVSKKSTFDEALRYGDEYIRIIHQLLFARSIYYNQGYENREENSIKLGEFVEALKKSGYEISFAIIVKKNEKTPKIVNGDLDPAHVYDELNTYFGLYTPNEVVLGNEVNKEYWATILKRAVIQQRVYDAKTQQEELKEIVKGIATFIDENVVDGKPANVAVKIDGKTQTVSMSATNLPKAPKPMKTCFCGCGEQATKMLRPASKCGARYVNAEHQLNAWKEHKANCETCFLYSQNEKAKKVERNLD